jgi:hypothetical protein
MKHDDVLALTPEDVARLVRESRRRQGLPERVCDAGTLARVAALVTASLYPPRLEAPPRINGGRVEPVAAADTGLQDDPLDHGADDRPPPR